MKAFNFVWILLYATALLACGRPGEIRLSLEVQPTTTVLEVFAAFPDQISTRSVVNYDLLRNAAIVSPSGALPTSVFDSERREFQAFWNRAIGRGTNFFGTTGYDVGVPGSIEVDLVPLNRRGFNLIVEFLLPFQSPTASSPSYYVVAYTCIRPNGGDDVKVTKDILEQIVDANNNGGGSPLVMGRSCGVCWNEPNVVGSNIGDDPNITFNLAADPGGPVARRIYESFPTPAGVDNDLPGPVQICPATPTGQIPL